MAKRHEGRDEQVRERALRQVRQFPDPVLKQRAREIEEFDDDLRALADRMVALMHDAHGAGLAAPQIGLLRRIFVYQLGDDERPIALVNPEIVDVSEQRDVGGEGCLSLALLIDQGHDVPVERPLRVIVKAHDLEGNEIERWAEGHEARVIQHELDHLDGVLILDRTTREARGEALRRLRNALT